MNKFGKELIEAINKVLGTNIPIDEETTNKIVNAIDEIIRNWDYGYCPDCDERIPDEPMINEGYL